MRHANKNQGTANSQTTKLLKSVAKRGCMKIDKKAGDDFITTM
jgi:hypothetical protein